MPGAQDTIMFQGTAICVFSHQEAATFTFVASTRKVTRPAGDFTTNYSPGQFFRPVGAVANLKRCFQIVSVTALEMVLDVAPADEASVACTLKVFDPAALITSFTGPESTNPRVDVSHSLSTAREYKPGLQDNGSFSFEGNTVRDDDGLITLKTLRNNRATAEFMVAYSDRLGFAEFLASVESGPTPTGSIDSAVTFSAALAVSGAVTDSELLS